MGLPDISVDGTVISSCAIDSVVSSVVMLPGSPSHVGYATHKTPDRMGWPEGGAVVRLPFFVSIKNRDCPRLISGSKYLE